MTHGEAASFDGRILVARMEDCPPCPNDMSGSSLAAGRLRFRICKPVGLSVNDETSREKIYAHTFAFA